MIVISMRHGIKDPKLFRPEIIRGALLQTAAKYMERQRTNITEGVTPTGEPFRPYSQAYALNKMRAGRDLSASWLVATGKMLRSQRMQVDSGPKRITIRCLFDGERPTNVFRQRRKRKRKSRDWSPLTIGMSTQKTVRNFDLARWNNRTRPFVGVSESWARELLQYFVDTLGRLWSRAP